MKKTIILGLVLAVGAITSFAQGTVNFANAGPGLNAPVFQSDGITKLSSAYTAELLAGTSAGSLTSIATTSFLSAAPGIFTGGTQTINSLTPGGPGFFEVRAFATSFGSYANAFASGSGYGSSSIFSLAATGNPTTVPPGTPATLIGLTSFTLVPEPSTLALLGLGAVSLLAFRRRK